MATSTEREQMSEAQRAFLASGALKKRPAMPGAGRPRKQGPAPVDPYVGLEVVGRCPCGHSGFLAADQNSPWLGLCRYCRSARPAAGREASSRPSNTRPVELGVGRPPAVPNQRG